MQIEVGTRCMDGAVLRPTDLLLGILCENQFPIGWRELIEGHDRNLAIGAFQLNVTINYADQLAIHFEPARRIGPGAHPLERINNGRR